MREAADRGFNNHLDEYIDHLFSNYEGAFLCNPAFDDNLALIEVKNNLAFLRDHLDLDFASWRSIVLRSVRLIAAAAGDAKEV
jgi:hypothetical protein